MVKSAVDAVCATGMPLVRSSSAMGDTESVDIGEEGEGKDARGMLSSGSGFDALRGEDEGSLEAEWVMILMEMLSAVRGEPGEEKRRPDCLALPRRDVSSVTVASERLRPCLAFCLDCLLRTPPVARQLELFDRTRDTAFRPRDFSPSPGLLPPDPLPAL